MGNGMWVRDGSRTSKYILTLTDPEGWYEADVSWDGCIHLRRAFNCPFPQPDMVDTIHICEIDETIKRLEAIKAFAIEHFGDWPD